MGRLGGWCDTRHKRIVVDSARPANARLRTLIHETMRALGVGYAGDGRERAEVIADTASHPACSGVGLDVAGESVAYAAGGARTAPWRRSPSSPRRSTSLPGASRPSLPATPTNSPWRRDRHSRIWRRRPWAIATFGRCSRCGGMHTSAARGGRWIARGGREPGPGVGRFGVGVHHLFSRVVRLPAAASSAPTPRDCQALPCGSLCESCRTRA
jgi:hypothetical protein